MDRGSYSKRILPLLNKKIIIATAIITITMTAYTYIHIRQIRIEPPKAVINASKTTADIGETITFDATQSTGDIPKK